jgi:hypothetical protein
MKALHTFVALLALLSACATSRSANGIDDEPAREDGSADLGTDAASESSTYVPETIPDATVLDCWPNTSDSTFGEVYREAKGICDDLVGSTCGTCSSSWMPMGASSA